MDANAAIQAIQAVGFPIVACGIMAWYVKYITDQNHRAIMALTERHKEDMDKVSEAINNNTVAMQQLTDYIKLKGE